MRAHAPFTDTPGVHAPHCRRPDCPADLGGRGHRPRSRRLQRKGLHGRQRTASRRGVRGGHTSFYNSRAFALAKVTKDTPNPSGGTFDKDTNGELNGRVTDLARGVFNRVGVCPSYSTEQRSKRERDGVAHISKQFVRYRLTTVHHEGGDLAAIQDVRSRGELRQRVSYEAGGPQEAISVPVRSRR
jgi:Amidohydrolase family